MTSRLWKQAQIQKRLHRQVGSRSYIEHSVVFPTGRSYLTDVVWWIGTLSSKCIAIYRIWMYCPLRFNLNSHSVLYLSFFLFWDCYLDRLIMNLSGCWSNWEFPGVQCGSCCNSHTTGSLGSVIWVSRRQFFFFGSVTFVFPHC